MAWVSNRYNAYKVTKKYKNGNVLLVNFYGATWKETPERLEAGGYKTVSDKPGFLAKGGYVKT